MSDFILQVVAGFLAADFISGFFHWLEDNYGDESWPVLGTHIIAPNRKHHSDQRAFLSGTYLYRNWTTIAPCFALLLLAIVSGAANPFVISACIVTSQANEIHAWAHQKCSRFVQLLQETVLQGPRHHAEHHESPFDCRYCVISPFLNPFLDAMGFWSLCETCLGIIGIKKSVKV